ncbi:hypothetical protein ACI48D_08035 [Massilia sp. LXY-6]|uniref:hypothetical protein n=1 Tax=Massilia sp. LXY-6 TaxID=3379823 RepID=UPI003EE18920
MSEDLFLGFPIAVALALAALVLILLGLVRVLAALGKPPTLRSPCDGHGDDAAHPGEPERQLH